MSKPVPVYAIPFAFASQVFLEGDPPEKGHLISYHLKRCSGKSHSCGERVLQDNSCLSPLSFYPEGAGCGLRDNDTIDSWKYTSSPLAPKPIQGESGLRKEGAAAAKTSLVWNDFDNQTLPKANKPFHYQLSNCNKSHTTCGIAERSDAGQVFVTLPACGIDTRSEIDTMDAYQTIEQWSYLKP